MSTKKLLITLAFLSFSPQVFGFSLTEGINGGGGTGVIVGQAYPHILLDLYRYEPDLIDLRTYPKIDSANQRNIPICYAENLSAKSLPVFSDVIQILDQWDGKVYGLIPHLRYAIENLQFRLATQSLELSDRDAAGDSDIVDQLVPIVRYHQVLGAVTDISALNSLGDISYRALLIHEGLRHIQELYKVPMTDAFILELTYALVQLSPDTKNIEGVVPKVMKRDPLIASIIEELIETHDQMCELRSLRNEVVCTESVVERVGTREILSRYIEELERIEKVSVGRSQISISQNLDNALALRMAYTVKGLSGISAFTYADLSVSYYNSMVSSARAQNPGNGFAPKDSELDRLCRNLVGSIFAEK